MKNYRVDDTTVRNVRLVVSASRKFLRIAESTIAARRLFIFRMQQVSRIHVVTPTVLDEIDSVMLGDSDVIDVIDVRAYLQNPRMIKSDAVDRNYTDNCVYR